MALGLGLGLPYSRVSGGPSNPIFTELFGQPALGLDLRDLTGTNPDIIRVRRSSDDAEQNFKAAEIVNGTLETWVGAGNNGLVRTWFGQGNGVNVEQGVAVNQPFIVTAGALETENGEPAIRLDGVNTFLRTITFGLDLNLGMSVFTVAKTNDISTSQFIWASVFDTANRCSLGVVSTGQTGFSHRLPTILSTSFNSSLNQTLITQTATGTTPKIFENSVLGTGTQALANAFGGNTIFYVGNNSSSSPSSVFNGKIQSIIAYNVDKTSQQSDIEANINNYYNIY